MTSAPKPAAPALRRSPVRLTLAIAGWVTVLLGVAYFIFGKHLHSFIHKWMLDREVAKVTKSLPECDTVEIFRLAPPTTATLTEAERQPGPDRFPIPPHRHIPIASRMKLAGSDAKEFLDLWRKQNVGHEFLTLQHLPTYAFRASFGGTVVFETSLCFDCRTFVVKASGTDALWGLDTSTDAAKALQQFLDQKLPK